jgi:hypothetical protein
MLEDAPQSPPAPQAPPAAPRTSPAVLAIVVVVGILILVGAIGAGIRAGMTDFGATQPQRGAAAGSIDGRTAAVFELARAAPTVIVRSAELGGSLYRISGATVEQSGDVVRAIGDNQDTMTVELNYHITWQIRLSDGAMSETLDLRKVPVSGVEIAGNAGSVDLTLGEARGSVPVDISGRVGTFAVHLPADVAVQVHVAGGADGVTLDGVTHTGVAAGTRFASDAADRYDIDATARLTTLTVDRR